MQAQSIKHITNFSQYSQYYNPSLTGFEGSGVKSFYRNQWTGFEDAPKTIFLSGELDLAGAKKRTDTINPYYNGARHALGLSLLQERFGPTKETQLFLSYGSGISLSEQWSLRWGTAVTYSALGMDGSSLTVDQESDPRYSDLIGQNNRVSKLDLNVGMSLTSSKFYLGYAMQDITKGAYVTMGDDYIRDFYTRKHILQTGYRTPVSEHLGIIANGIMQYDEELKETLEGQLKLVYNNMFWAGGGYRKDLAYSVTAGIRIDQLRISYAFENPAQNARAINKSTNEIAISYNLRPLRAPQNGKKQLTIW